MLNAASEGQKRRWAKVSAEKRSQLMSDVNKKKWAKIPKTKRKAHSAMMTAARLKKSHGRKRTGK